MIMVTLNTGLDKGDHTKICTIMKIKQTTDSDQNLVKSVHCKQLGLVQIIKYRTHVIKGKKQIGTAVNMPQYELIGQNTSFARFFITSSPQYCRQLKKKRK